MIRNFFQILFPFIPGLLFLTCSDHDGTGNEGEPSDDFIHILSHIAVSGEQLSEDNFVAGDRIGLYVVPYEQDSPGAIGADNYITNQELVFSGSEWNRPEGGALLWPGNSTIDLYGYYPYDPGVIHPREYIFTVKENQSTQEGYNASDFLLALTAGVTPRSSIPVIFYHKLSRININIDAEVADDSSQTEVEVEVYDMLPSAIIDFAAGTTTVDPGKNRIAIDPLPVESTDADYSHSFSAIVPPQAIDTGTRLLRISIDGTNYFYRTAAPLTLVQGSTLTFNIAVTQLGISVTVDLIHEWMEGGTVEGNLGGSAPRVLDLSEVDWTQSLVYDVYYRNSRIGEICRECLFVNNGNINAQAIVVYPVDTDGEVNLAAGFVAQVMNRDRNLNTNLYEPNADSVHGGKVVFGASNNLASYTPGTSPLIDLVRIVSSGEVTAAEDNSAVILEVRPRLLRDIDGNDYPLVKIGTQYWTASNAKMQHYRDGTELQVYWYQDNIANKDLYGGYYLWATVTDARQIAPEGWRVPEGTDWTSLGAYLMPNAGSKLKSNTLWSNLSNGNNVTGFNGLPAGRRTDTGIYNEFNNYGQWWSQTSATANDAYRLYLDYGNTSMHYTTLAKTYTQNVRFIRD